MNNKTKRSIPSHVAIIPDGNRRWARLNKIPLFLGYSKGIKKFVDFAMWSKEFGVKTLTVWGLSSDNMKKRSSLERRVLFELYTKAAKDKKLIKMLADNKVRLNIIGDIGELPKRLRNALADIEERTSKYTDLTINLLINYGGREDIIHSMKLLQKEHGKIGEEDVRKNLLTSSVPDVDLIVRTSGEMRLSGLLPWQTAYSELYFAKKYWPEFEKQDFKRAIALFSKRHRRFGE